MKDSIKPLNQPNNQVMINKESETDDRLMMQLWNISWVRLFRLVAVGSRVLSGPAQLHHTVYISAVSIYFTSSVT